MKRISAERVMARKDYAQKKRPGLGCYSLAVRSELFMNRATTKRNHGHFLMTDMIMTIMIFTALKKGESCR